MSLKQRESPRVDLIGVRRVIDGIDDGLLILLAARRRLVGAATQIKSQSQTSPRDCRREKAVFDRARRLGERLGVPVESSDHLMSMLIDDACRQQGLGPSDVTVETIADSDDLDQCGGPGRHGTLSDMMTKAHSARRPLSWLRLLPPPVRLEPLARRLPQRWQARCLEAAMRKVLAGTLAAGALDLLSARRIGIEVSDLSLRWVVCLKDGQMQVCHPLENAEATVSGTATDLMLLASRREDADTLFFQRRLKLTGDTELGLTARNLLDQLPWHEVPLGLRILMHRGAGLAEAARAAYHDTSRS